MYGRFRFPILLVTISIISVFLGACSGGRTAEVPATPRVPIEAWSLPLAVEPLREASPQERLAAEAVALVRLADGATASGFFVSPDGLFLTSYHAVGPGECRVDRCPWLQLVREFTPGGAVERFDQIRPLAQFPELDVTLLEVALPAGRGAVPYLTLASVDEAPGEGSVLAHPFSASNHVLRVGSLTVQGNKLVFAGAVLPGMSGGPVFDQRSQRVAGVVRSVLPDLGSASKSTGTIQSVSVSAHAGAVRRAVGQIFPQTRGHALWSRAMFEQRVGDQSIAVHSADEAPTTKLSLANWGTPAGDAQLLAAFERVELVPESMEPETFLDFVDQAVTLTLATGVGMEPLMRVQSAVERLDPEQRDGRMRRYRALVGSVQRGQCVADATPDRELSLNAASQCLSPNLADGSRLLDRLADRIVARASARSKDQRFPTVALDAVQALLAYEQVDVPARRKAMGILRDTVQEADGLRDAFEAEGLWTLLSEKPELVGPRSFR